MKKKNTLSDMLFLQLSIQHEEAMAKLYTVLADKVPCAAGLWKELCQEELSHAKQLRRLLDKVKHGEAYLDPVRHTADIVKIALDSLEPRIQTWKQWGVDKKDAFEYTLLMEGGIIEQRFFLPSPEDSELTKETFYEMTSGTSHHLDRIEEEYAKNSLGAGFLKHFKARMKSFLALESH